MKVIIYQGSKQFRNKKCESKTQESNAIQYIKNHSFYKESFPVDQILKQIKQRVKQESQDNNHIKNKIEQLSLYLNKDNNRLMFEIYEIVLKNPKGITYQQISKKTKLQIYNISHYCCRLKKMNFVRLEHDKSQKRVFPNESYQYDDSNTKDGSRNSKSEKKRRQFKSNEKEKDVQKNDDNVKRNEEDEQQVQQVISKPFHFNQLSIVDNIWVNVSSYESYKKNGVTNEDIKQRLSKTSETKLIMKLVEQVKDIYSFDREMVSKGKVFVNKYKNVTKNIQTASIQPDDSVEVPQNETLNPRIQAWLKAKFPQFPHQKFLFHFINNQLKGYLSATGARSARRTCTPIKLVRYIKILNSLNMEWPQTDIKLKKYLIGEEMSLPNGTMHKRSIVGILDGLVEKGILRKQEPFYYPMWEPQGKQVYEEQWQQQITIAKPKKKVHMSLDSLESKKQIGKKISTDQYKYELKTRLFYVHIQELITQKLKKAFKRIMFAKRSKTGIKMYEPETHILHILDQPFNSKLPVISSQNYNEFIEKLDEFIESKGRKQQAITVGYDVIKLFRKYHQISENQLKTKFGNNWLDKIKPLINQNIIGKDEENGCWCLKQKDRYFL